MYAVNARTGIAIIAAIGLLTGCVAAGGAPASDVSPLPVLNLSIADASAASVDLSPLPASAKAVVVTASDAVATATVNAMGGASRGPLVGVARGVVLPGSLGAGRTVWAVAFGPGGKVPMMGPVGGTPAPILLQVALIDDQTGEFLGNYIKSEP